MHGLFADSSARKAVALRKGVIRGKSLQSDAVRRAIDYAFQPIVNVYDGSVYGYEALLRGHQRLGFAAISELFDRAHKERRLDAIDQILQEKAFTKFAGAADCSRLRLFFNLDTRTLGHMAERLAATKSLLDRLGISIPSVVFELSELMDITADPLAVAGVQQFRADRFKIAIDDFGAGFSGLKLMYENQPDIVKIDRFFISGIDDDEKKRLFVSKTVELAHILGISVVAEGVETEREFTTCKEIGCDLAQGYFIARPETDPAAIVYGSEKIVALNRRDRRSRRRDDRIIRDQIQVLPPLRIGDTLEAVQAAFQERTRPSFLPVVDEQGTPIGLVREADLKYLVQAAFGRDILSAKALGKTLKSFVSRCPVADVNAGVDRFLEVFSLNENPDGILVVEDFQYIGFLSAAALLRVVNDKNVVLGRGQNPLTKLPGNNLINDYVGNALETSNNIWSFVFFDFDNFKPFNDTYGFRQGDRAIVLFSELMGKKLDGRGIFRGHIGGDDFFAGFRNMAFPEVVAAVQDLLNAFGDGARSLYDADARRSGMINVPDRDGTVRGVPLMGCSAVLVLVAGHRGHGSADDLARLVTALKAEAKRTSGEVLSACLV